jgi:dodecin
VGQSGTNAEMQASPPRGETSMSVAKVIELSATSTTSFEDAIQQGIARATKTLKNVQGAWIKEQQVNIKDGKVDSYRVNMMITFILGDGVGE